MTFIKKLINDVTVHTYGATVTITAHFKYIFIVAGTFYTSFACGACVGHKKSSHLRWVPSYDKLLHGAVIWQNFIIGA